RLILNQDKNAPTDLQYQGGHPWMTRNFASSVPAGRNRSRPHPATWASLWRQNRGRPIANDQPSSAPRKCPAVSAARAVGAVVLAGALDPHQGWPGIVLGRRGGQWMLSASGGAAESDGRLVAPQQARDCGAGAGVGGR